ncbi:POK9 protein, partial [Rhinoptilus africanus]|nr:POK9 protein [Rhinoptilus africanus]
GSLGLDLAATVDVTLIDNRPQKVPSGIRGPVIIDGKPQGALLLGRSSSGLKGLFVLPGVIDKDYTGEIGIVVQTHFPPLHIPKGSKIDQLVTIPQLVAEMQPESTRERGASGFGSTGGLALLTLPMNRRPVATALLLHHGEQLHLNALLDTGADLTIAS